MGRPASSRVKFYAGAVGNVVLWLLVLLEPAAATRSVSLEQSVPVLTAGVFTLVGSGAVGVLLLDQVKDHPTLAPRVLTTFTLSMLAYTLVYWAGKSAFSSLVSIPPAAEWAVRGAVIVAMLVGIRRLHTKRRLLIALVALVPILILPALDFILLGLAGAIGGLCAHWPRRRKVRSLAWALGLATLTSSVVAISALLSGPAATSLTCLQVAAVVAAAGIQAHNLHVLSLVSATPLNTIGSDRTSTTERSLQP